MKPVMIDVSEENEHILCLLDSISRTTESFKKRVKQFQPKNTPAAAKLILQIVYKLEQIDDNLDKIKDIGIT